MKQLIGIGLFLILLYALFFVSHPGARTLNANLDLLIEISLLGFIGLGAGLLIISGGIDLSIGSVAVLAATIQGYLIKEAPGYPGLHPLLTLFLVLMMGAVIGLIHGLIVTQLRIQAFVVTLCGLFIYRGIARSITGDAKLEILDVDFNAQFEYWQTWLYKGFVIHREAGWKQGLFVDRHLSMFPIFLAVIFLLAFVFLHLSVYGRYLTAIGNNEKAVRYSGIKSTRYRILAYVLCSLLASLYGGLYLMKTNGVTPQSSLMALELEAIAVAVLGGCSLRGGEGSVLGILIGACLFAVLRNLLSFRGVGDAVMPIVTGIALLLGAIIDEAFRRQRKTKLLA